MSEAPAPGTPSPPEGEYAIVEVMGHRTLIGRVEEVERFGSKLMSIQPIYKGKLLEAVMIGGGSIYQYTPCSPEAAFARAPKDLWSLPASVRAVLPPEMLPPPTAAEEPSFCVCEDGAVDFDCPIHGELPF